MERIIGAEVTQVRFASYGERMYLNEIWLQTKTGDRFVIAGADCGRLCVMDSHEFMPLGVRVREVGESRRIE